MKEMRKVIFSKRLLVELREIGNICFVFDLRFTKYYHSLQLIFWRLAVTISYCRTGKFLPMDWKSLGF